MRPQSRKRFSKKPNESTPLPDRADLVAAELFMVCQWRPRIENDLRRPIVIDVDQFTSPSQSTLLLPDRATCAAMTPLVRCMSQSVHELLGDPGMSEDIIVLGGLAGLLCWTYIILPLIYHVS
jgi:hypothetical protein